MTDLINFELKNKKLEIEIFLLVFGNSFDVVFGYIKLAENLYKSEKFIGSCHYLHDQRLKKVESERNC